jgi:hypothetical protein
MTRIIGAEAIYQGTAHRFMRGLKVRIVAVLKGVDAPDRDGEDDYSYLRDDAEVLRNGGLTEHDRVEVQPWIEEERRFSFVTSDARVADLVGLPLASIQ